MMLPELEFTDAAFDTLGFSLEEKQDAYKITSSIMHLGEMTFKAKGREEGCEPDDVAPGQKICKLYLIENWQLFYGNFIRPKIKVGTEWVYKGQNADNCLNAIAALARSMYNRLFLWLVDLCNRTLIDPTMKKVNFIGILDIAGFEIFEFNTFEQICINFCNEKLQQFFNHHMFVLEQEEYVREGIEWEMVDFGMDLEATINCMEKPMGLMAILEEETMFPKATDKSFDPGCFFRKAVVFPNRFSFSLSSKDLSVAFGNMVSSSRMAIRPMGFSIQLMVASRSMPKSTISHSMPSLTYSSCSSTNM